MRTGFSENYILYITRSKYLHYMKFIELFMRMTEIRHQFTVSTSGTLQRFFDFRNNLYTWILFNTSAWDENAFELYGIIDSQTILFCS